MTPTTCLLITIWKDRSHLLRKSLERLCQLTQPTEVLIVNDGGDQQNTDQLLQVMAEFQNRLPIRYVYTNNLGLTMCSHARNVGIRNTTCDLIISTEPEVLFITDTVKQLTDHYIQNPQSCINTACIYRIETDIELTQDMIEHPDNYPCMAKRYGWTGNCVTLYNRQWLLDINGWDEEFPRPYMGDDVDLSQRLELTKHNLLNMNDIEVVHQYHPKEDFGSNIDPNMNYLKNKDVQNNRHLIKANQGIQWGIIKQ